MTLLFAAELVDHPHSRSMQARAFRRSKQAVMTDVVQRLSRQPFLVDIVRRVIEAGNVHVRFVGEAEPEGSMLQGHLFLVRIRGSRNYEEQSLSFWHGLVFQHLLKLMPDDDLFREDLRDDVARIVRNETEEFLRRFDPEQRRKFERTFCIYEGKA